MRFLQADVTGICGLFPSSRCVVSKKKQKFVKPTVGISIPFHDTIFFFSKRGVFD